MPVESFSVLPLDSTVLTAASPWGIPVQVLSETTSSNDDLLRMGEENAPAGTLLFAERQTAGRGQFGRPWSSAPGLGLWFSLILRLPIDDDTIPLLSAFAAVALVEMIRGLCIAGCGIKSPNDVLINGQKVAGILVETRVGRDPFAVVGIGLNVNHSREDFPEELRDRSCSVAMANANGNGKDKRELLDRNKLAAILLRHLREKERLMSTDPGLLLSTWNEMLIRDTTP
jgi:BirA family biotin operon repressor/biotin-[acetyl-CoA-carboxylase] ligase